MWPNPFKAFWNWLFGAKPKPAPKPIPQPEIYPSELILNRIPSARLPFKNPPHIRRAAPDAFLVSLFKWISESVQNDVIFGAAHHARADIFHHLGEELGLASHSTRKYRAACMFELLRVSAAMESSFDWGEGRDKSAQNHDLYVQEAGIFQTSPNSHVYVKDGAYKRWDYLDKLVARYGVGLVRVGSPNNEKWNRAMKDPKNAEMIFEHHAFMLRHNYRHYGPMIDKGRVGANINLNVIREVEALL